MSMGDYSEPKLTYGDYLKVPELLQLQHCLADPPSHDELQFIIIHQTYELWFKLVLFELDSIVEFMNKDDTRRATWLFHRVHAILKILYQQIHILESMSPTDFLDFRDKLQPASGFQSLQFREIEFVSNLKEPAILQHLKVDKESMARLEKRLKGETLWDAFLNTMRRQGFQIPKNRERDRVIQELVKLHQEQDQHYDLFLLSEAMIEHDELLGLWRLHHVKMVERMIGNKIGTGGSEGVRYLSATTAKKCFPELWDMRTFLKKS
jgi:tryptophan 2,3-dioxygenase